MSRVKSVRLILALLVAALLPVLAGCGSGSDVGAAADVVPADVFLYASVDTDFDGDGWAALEEFAARFPDGDNLMQSLADELESGEEGIDFEQDVKPALGDEVAFVLLDAPATPELDVAYRRRVLLRRARGSSCCSSRRTRLPSSGCSRRVTSRR